MEKTKLEFNCVLDQISPAKLNVIKKIIVSPKNLVGTWVNCNKATPNVLNVIIGYRRGVLTVHMFGNCGPTPCDWTEEKGLAYAENVGSIEAVAFSVFHKPSFKETIITGHLCNGCLIVEMFNHFTDGSHRSDYYLRECFYRK